MGRARNPRFTASGVRIVGPLTRSGLGRPDAVETALSLTREELDDALRERLNAAIDQVCARPADVRLDDALAKKRAQIERSFPGGVSSGKVRQELTKYANTLLKNNGMGNFRRGVAAKERLRRKQKQLVIRKPTRPEYDQGVYVIGCAGQPIKIGVAKNVEQRVSTLQTGFPHKLRVYAHLEITCGSAVSIEREAHRRLAEFRMNGEWFDYDPYDAIELLKEIISERTGR